MPARRDQKLSFLQLHNFHITGSSHCYSLSVWVEFMASIIEKRTMLQLSELIVSLTRGWDWGWLRSTHSTEMRRDPPPPREFTVMQTTHMLSRVWWVWEVLKDVEDFSSVFFFSFFFAFLDKNVVWFFRLKKKVFGCLALFKKVVWRHVSDRRDRREIDN